MKKLFWHTLATLLIIMVIFLSVDPIQAGGESPFTMRLVSHTPPRQAGNNFSDYGYSSAMGHYVVFSSFASNLVSDRNSKSDHSGNRYHDSYHKSDNYGFTKHHAYTNPHPKGCAAQIPTLYPYHPK